MLPKPICKSPETIRHEHAQDVARVIDTVYEEIFGKLNRLPRRDAPVVCASTAGIYGYWSLECNDPELTGEQLELLIERARDQVMQLVAAECGQPLPQVYQIYRNGRLWDAGFGAEINIKEQVGTASPGFSYGSAMSYARSYAHDDIGNTYTVVRENDADAVVGSFRVDS